ncbi:unannotated protein [freshwater metagenome]|uniref:Unannotated protein n=1 Tax=freshwater metagenome TaxID=449393 RepID=A0A6J6JFP4_9ZZZZ
MQQLHLDAQEQHPRRKPSCLGSSRVRHGRLIRVSHRGLRGLDGLGCGLQTMNLNVLGVSRGHRSYALGHGRRVMRSRGVTRCGLRTGGLTCLNEVRRHRGCRMKGVNRGHRSRGVVHGRHGLRCRGCRMKGGHRKLVGRRMKGVSRGLRGHPSCSEACEQVLRCLRRCEESSRDRCLGGHRSSRVVRCGQLSHRGLRHPGCRMKGVSRGHRMKDGRHEGLRHRGFHKLGDRRRQGVSCGRRMTDDLHEERHHRGCRMKDVSRGHRMKGGRCHENRCEVRHHKCALGGLRRTHPFRVEHALGRFLLVRGEERGRHGRLPSP